MIRVGMRIWEAEEERRGPDSGGQVDGGQETDPRDIRLRQSLFLLCTILEVEIFLNFVRFGGQSLTLSFSYSVLSLIITMFLLKD